MLRRCETQEQRNDPCSCGSGLKFKRCHGDPAKLQVVKHVVNEAMLIMIARAKNESGLMNGTEYSEVIQNPKSVLRQFYDMYGFNHCRDCGMELETKCEKCLRVE